jgi:hypothetical protein
MKIKDNKCKCGNDDFFFADKGNQTGIYCSYCGKWLKWADKDEQNLRMKQTSVLDKIITDIENIEIEGYVRDVECFNAGINTTLNIINKYR